MQRFDPGFGFTGGPYTIQPMYAPAINYNTEFPQLGAALRSPISAENQPRPLPQHLPGPWATSVTPGIGYGPAESMMPPLFSQNHVSARSSAAIYLHSTQYPCQRPGMTFIHPHEQVHQPFSQVWQKKFLSISIICACYLLNSGDLDRFKEEIAPIHTSSGEKLSHKSCFDLTCSHYPSHRVQEMIIG